MPGENYVKLYYSTYRNAPGLANVQENKYGQPNKTWKRRRTKIDVFVY